MDGKKSKYKTSLKERLLKGDVSVFRDSRHALYHDKVMIIDRKTVLTGSFNFKKDAEQSNAENLLRLHSEELARKYLRDWELHRSHSEAQLQQQ